MRFEPHPYQQRGIELLTQEPGGAGLLLDPGMGKTSIALAAFEELHREHKVKMLVIVPINPMYGTWPAEAQKWEQFRHLRLSLIHGPPERRRKALEADADVYLVNPEGVPWLFDTAQLKRHPNWSILCVDESTKFKKSDTKRFKAIKKHLPRFTARWILTGTIAPNGLEDLFGQVYIMDLGASLGKLITHYRQQYFNQVGFRGYTWVPRIGAVEQVTEKIEARTLQLKAEDYLDMPDFMKVDRLVELPADVMKQYKALEDEFYLEIGDAEVIAPNAAALGQKCRQLANGAVYDQGGEPHYIHGEKLAALDDIREETNGHPLLIMYEFRHDAAALLRHLGDDAMNITHFKKGSFELALEQFNNGEIPYLLMHPSTAHGMNIQKSCHHIVWYSIQWNLEYYIQSNTRLYRQGQAAPMVMCYHLVAKGTLDEKVSAALREKEITQALIEENLRKTDVTRTIA